MKQSVWILILLVILPCFLSAVRVVNSPFEIQQPNGKVIQCLTSGDEYYHWVHDEKGYTIVQNHDNGYYYYAQKVADQIVPSQYQVGTIDPTTTELTTWIKISNKEYLQKRNDKQATPVVKSRAATTGTLNNIVILIKFNDQPEFTTPRSEFINKFNSTEPNVISLKDFYQEVSYNLLTIDSSIYPTCGNTVNLSYVDSHPRDYYRPYDATTNPIGYVNGNYMGREQALLKNAVLGIASQVPEDLDIDNDDDGRVDNVCFIIRGANDGWSECLWAHRYYLNTQTATINGKRVYDYTFQPETQNDVYTVCHEMFHALGAPDLYHYSDSGAGVGPVDVWDLMDGGFVHPTAYMKFRYGHWIDFIPQIDQTAVYYLHPTLQKENCAYIIASPNSTSEYIIAEYRKKQVGTYEYSIPESGILFTRVNQSLDGQGNAQGPPDELYAYRPGGSPTSDGTPSLSAFSAANGRTIFGNETDPYCFLSDGTLADILVGNIGAPGDSICFTLNPGAINLHGHITINDNLIPASQVAITVNNTTINPDNSGNYSISLLSGTYQIKATASYYFTVDTTIVIPSTVTDIQQDLTILRAPAASQLQGQIIDGTIVLSWHFDNTYPELFNNFRIMSGSNSNATSQIRVTSDTTIALNGIPMTHPYYFRIIANYGDDNSAPSDFIYINPNSVADNNEVINKTEITQVYPNPFNPSTQIHYALQKAATVHMTIYNSKGQKVKQYVLNETAGNHSITWNGVNDKGSMVGSGVYFCQLKIAGQEASVKKLMMIK